MDGITDAAFRSLVLDLGDAGGAVTEFLRLTTGAPGTKVLRRELGPPHPSIPVGLQVMAPGPEWVAETAARAGEAGASFLDLNFGCPVNKVVSKNGGSSLLRDCPLLERVARGVVKAVAPFPVTAKIRIGWCEQTINATTTARILEDCGIQAIAVHGR
ncbi:MAG: tRNA-dihydrouridine synthase family protein, partial [Planctomycetaceae bacterium]|nr:tRNA-dihydrouridine synthase family protein [Planctomycetaceae bacterium]